MAVATPLSFTTAPGPSRLRAYQMWGLKAFFRGRAAFEQVLAEAPATSDEEPAQVDTLAHLVARIIRAVELQTQRDDMADWEHVLQRVPGLAPALQRVHAHVTGTVIIDCAGCAAGEDRD
jgi:hypothetical protein